MKGRNILFGGFNTFPLRYLPQGVHNMGYINSIGASCGTSFARSAHPNSVAIKDFVFQSEMNRTDEFMGNDVHSKRERAPIGAFLALKASGDFLLT